MGEHLLTGYNFLLYYFMANEFVNTLLNIDLYIYIYIYIKKIVFFFVNRRELKI